MTPRLHVFHNIARSNSFNPPHVWSVLSTYIFSKYLFSTAVDISLLNCFRAVHVFFNNSVNSEPILERLAARWCCLFIQGFAKKAKFLRENGLPAPCVSACLHKWLCAWLAVSWERTCVLWFGEYVLLNADDITVSWIVFQLIQQKSWHILLPCSHFSSLNFIPVMDKSLGSKTFHCEPSIHPSISCWELPNPPRPPGTCSPPTCPRCLPPPPPPLLSPLLAKEDTLVHPYQAHKPACTHRGSRMKNEDCC